MNIWIVYQFASTPDLPGSQRTYQYARAFADMGNNVTLWTSSFSHYGRFDTIKGDVPFVVREEGNLKIISLRTSPPYQRNDYRRVLNLIDFARVFMKYAGATPVSPDVIIASYPSPFAALAAYGIAKKRAAKFVLEVRDLWPQVWVERGVFSVLHPFVLLLYGIEKYLYRNAQTVVSALPYIQDYMAERGMRNREIIWIPNPVSLNEFAGQKTEIPEESRIICAGMRENTAKGIMNVAYVGGLGPANRVDVILEASKILRDTNASNISFTIVGEGHSKKELMKFILDNRLDSVVLCPSVSARSVPSILQCADAGVLCLHQNPIYRFGVNLHKTYDYMAAGLPIVFSADVKNDIVKASGAGFTVTPGSAEEIASALKHLASMSPEQRRLMGSRGYRYVADYYDIRILSRRYIGAIGPEGQSATQQG
ncbi:MAG: glycosyltransferase family 4 protein [Nitrospirae bacterium]|nr:glycosyltransferase family 4 protein [Nitrospirota bacterium]